MTEDEILRVLASFTHGIGDDCAVVRPPAPKHELLLTVDTVIENIHFTRDQTPQAIGRKAMVRSLSDIAAMGGDPLYCLVSITMAPWVDRRWLSAFYRGATSAFDGIVGGDLSHSSHLVANTTIIGQVPTGQALRRDGAKPGDVLFVSGPLGGWKHKRRPEARLDLGRKLLHKASACIDITDSLTLDLHRLCRQSNVAAVIDSVPLLSRATTEQALYDGEDYELLYTAPPRKRVPGIPIGRIIEGKPGSLTYLGKPLKPQGYDHAQQRSRSD